jgi:hypothetical protein
MRGMGLVFLRKCMNDWRSDVAGTLDLCILVDYDLQISRCDQSVNVNDGIFVLLNSV